MTTDTYTQEKIDFLLSQADQLMPAFKLLPFHAMLTDSDGRILYANPAAIAVTGFTIEEMRGRTAGELWGGNMERGFYREMWQKIKKEKGIFKGTLINRTKAGDWYMVYARVFPILDPSGDPILFAGLEFEPIEFGIGENI